MSFTDPMAPWVTQPRPGERVPLPLVILFALASKALELRETGHCHDCGVLLCPDHRSNAGLADLCEDAYSQVAAVSPEWADLAIAINAGMN